MSRPCGICNHPLVAAINSEVRARQQSGVTIKDIAAKYAINDKNLGYHIQHCLNGGGPISLSPIDELPTQDDLLQRLEALSQRLVGYEGVGVELLEKLRGISEDPSKLFEVVFGRRGEPTGELTFVAGPLLRTLNELRKFNDSEVRLVEIIAAVRMSALEAEERRRRQIDILASPAWHALRDRIFAALQPYPDALLAIRRSLIGDVVDVTPRQPEAEPAVERLGAGSADDPAPSEDPSS